MFKTLAVVMLLLMLLVIFQGPIKGFIVEQQISLVISRLDLSVDTTDYLKEQASRIGRGYADRKFSEIEKEALLSLRVELRTLAKRGDEADAELLETDAKRIAGQFETILKRHRL